MVWLGSFRRATLNEMMFRSVRNPGCKLKTLAGLDTMLEMMYLYDDQGGIQLIDAYESARDFGEAERHSERVGNVGNRRYMT